MQGACPPAHYCEHLNIQSMTRGWYKLNEDKTTTALPEGVYPTDMDFKRSNRIVGRDEFDEQAVSTVFLALDHNFGDGPPLLFETMVFGGKYDQWMDRYHTYEEALAGHNRVIDRIKNNKPLEP